MRTTRMALVVALLCVVGCTPTAPEERTGTARQELTAAATPIIITHGLAAWPFDASLKPHLESQGYQVLMPKVSPFGPVKDRAEELRTQIDAYLDDIGADRCVIVAHSMGGVDARWLVSPDGLGYDRVAAVVTIASPHRGTAIADWVLKGAPPWLESRATRFLKLFDLTPNEAQDLEALYDLSKPGMATFNATVHDNPSVEYYSYSSVQSPTQGLNPLLYVSYYVIKSKDGANDGIASEEGARWGHFLGELNADHADHIGGLGIPTKFDFRGLYDGAISQAFSHYNAGTYAPTFSKPAIDHPFPQSQHAYFNNTSKTQRHTVAGASSIAVTFDERTEVESGYDLLHVLSGDGTPVPNSPFTGFDLAGATITVPGDTVAVRLESDFSVTRWGYRITHVEAQP